MNPLSLPLYALLLLWALWYLYLIVIGLYRAHLMGRLTVASTLLGAPALIVGVLLDWLINWTVAAIWFREFPFAFTELVTGRLTRYIAFDDGWRNKHARIICASLLDPYDPNPGGHCQ